MSMDAPRLTSPTKAQLLRLAPTATADVRTRPGTLGSVTDFSRSRRASPRGETSTVAGRPAAAQARASAAAPARMVPRKDLRAGRGEEWGCQSRVSRVFGERNASNTVKFTSKRQYIYPGERSSRARRRRFFSFLRRRRREPEDDDDGDGDRRLLGASNSSVSGFSSARTSSRLRA